MVNFAKRAITEELDSRLLGVLLKIFQNIKTKKDLKEFLDKFLTPEEQIMIKKRLAIVLFLREDKKTKEITNTLDVSRATVSFVKKGLKRSSRKENKLKPITKKDLKQRKSRFPAISGKNRWRFLDVTY
jgi:uncharacterized protein YerC